MSASPCYKLVVLADILVSLFEYTVVVQDSVTDTCYILTALVDMSAGILVSVLVDMSLDILLSVPVDMSLDMSLNLLASMLTVLFHTAPGQSVMIRANLHVFPCIVLGSSALPSDL